MNPAYKSLGYTALMPRQFTVDDLLLPITLIKMCVVVSTGIVALNLMRHCGENICGVELLLCIFLISPLDQVSV
jgi:hypothetical protein